MDTTQLPPVKFQLSFTQEVDTYIQRSRKELKDVSVGGFAKFIGTDEKSIWAWATKNKKDENGVTTSELARPSFFAAIKGLEKLEKEDKVKLIKEEMKEERLNPKQELFCQLYAKSRESFGNGALSYANAYGIDIANKPSYDTARTSASTLLTNPNILLRIKTLLGDITDQEVDEELAFVIRQSYELPSKVAAIREWNKLKSRITEKMDHTTNGKDLPTPIYNGTARTD